MSTQQTNQQPTCNDVVSEFFMSWGNHLVVDKLLWQILLAAFNSRDTNDLTPFERAQLLDVYRSVTELLASLNQIHKQNEA
jgi:hypothetical protein